MNKYKEIHRKNKVSPAVDKIKDEHGADLKYEVIAPINYTDMFKCKHRSCSLRIILFHVVLFCRF